MEQSTRDLSDLQPKRTWAPVSATLATLAVIVAAVGASLLPVFFAPMPVGPFPVALVLASVAAMQLIMGLGGWWLAGLKGGDRRAVLSLGTSRLSFAKGVAAILAMLAVTSAYQAFRYYVLGHDIFADMRALAPLFHGPLWPLAVLLVALGAPLAEEILFRGFLQSAFKESTKLYWLGAVIATVLWTMLHVQYGVPALMLVALMGLMFTLMLRASGSLRLPVAAHMFNNGVACAYLLLVMKP